MKTKPTIKLATVLLGFSLFGTPVLPVAAAPADAPSKLATAPTPVALQAAIDRGAAYLLKSQNSNGWWSTPEQTGNGHPDSGLSYFFPVTEDMIGKTIDAVVLQFESEGKFKVPLGQFSSEVWITAYPIPYVSKTLVLEE